MEHSEKIESALVAYLKTGTYPTGFDKTTQIHAGESDVAKDKAVIICNCGDAEEEYPLNSGNFWHTINIEVRTPILKNTNLTSHKAVASVVENLVLIDDLDVQLTTYGSAFTCQGVIDRKPTREQPETYWASGWAMRILSCPIAFA